MCADGPPGEEAPGEWLRREAREWWADIAEDRKREGAQLHLPQMSVDVTDSTNLELFVLTLEEAPSGARLAVSVSELDWARVDRIARTANPEVHVHWIGEGMDAPAPPQEFGLYPPFLHRWVWDPAVRSWAAGLYRQGILDAATSIEGWVGRKLAAPSLSGARLYDAAFGLCESGPRLRFTDTAPGSDDWKSRHQAAKWLGKAVSAGLRNVAAHTTDPIPAQVAIEYLASLSVLARWVEEAELVVDGVRPTPVAR